MTLYRAVLALGLLALVLGATAVLVCIGEAAWRRAQRREWGE